MRETEALINISGGDARKLYNLLELVVNAASPNTSEGKASPNTPEGGALPTHKTQQKNTESKAGPGSVARSDGEAPPSEGFGEATVIITDALVMSVAQKKVALPISSLAKITIRLAINFTSSPPSIILASQYTAAL